MVKLIALKIRGVKLGILNLSFFSFIVFYGCSNRASINNIENRSDLEVCIASNVRIPFNNYDTVILKESEAIYSAGEMYKEKKYDEYLPNLESIIYFSELQKKTSKPLIIWNEDFSRKIYERVYYDKIEIIDSARNAEITRRYQKVYENMVFIKLGGKVVSKDTVKITESFLNRGSEIFINKVFFLDDGKWSSTTTDTLKYIK